MLLAIMIMVIPDANGQIRFLTLDSCRTLALSSNKELRMAEMQRQSACWQRKAAFTAYLPKVSASGAYMHTGKELSLLSDEQKTALSNMGNAMSLPQLNAVGQGLVEALRTDTRNLTGAAVILTQPVYMGGKIKAYNAIAGYAERLAGDQYNLKRQELIADVDETYWNIVSLAAKKRLAASYLNLVDSLDNDISQLIAEGFATKADGLSVKVKINEANVAMIQVDNGLELMKMRLCQICGIDMDGKIELADEQADRLPDPPVTEPYGSEDIALELRPELSALGAAARIYDEKIRLARAEFMPNVALTGGYMFSDPSVFNSFEKRFNGTWNIGVAVNIPLLTWGERCYKVKAAKADAAKARFHLEEMREKVELQVAQSRSKLQEAHERYVASVSSCDEADENLRYATLGLREGVIPVINVIEAQTAWLSARTGLISAGIDLRLADLYMRKSLGTIR